MVEFKALEFEIIECCNCHVQFCVTKEHKRDLYSSKETFYCPNGHPQSYTGKSNKTVIDNLTKQINVCSIKRNELISKLDSRDKSIKSYKMLLGKQKKKFQMK